MKCQVIAPGSNQTPAYSGAGPTISCRGGAGACSIGNASTLSSGDHLVHLSLSQFGNSLRHAIC